MGNELKANEQGDIMADSEAQCYDHNWIPLLKTILIQEPLSHDICMYCSSISGGIPAGIAEQP